MRRIRTFREAWPRLTLLCVWAIIASALSLLVGPGLAVSEWLSALTGGTSAIIVWELRVPRALVALLVGASLSASGAVVQALLRNPLAGPEILGISSGSAAGALVLSSLVGWSWGGAEVIVGGLLGALGCASIVLGLATSRNGTSLSGVLLAGMALSSLLTALTTLVLTLHRETQVGRYLFWLVGSLENRRWEHVLVILPAALTSLALMLVLSGRLNVLTLGDREARSLGLRVQPLKLALLFAVAVATAGAVSVSGAIGFLGLLIPHSVRLLWGQDARWFVPLSAVAGAAFLVTADALVRLLFSPFEIPVGILTALLGAPFFLFILARSKGQLE